MTTRTAPAIGPLAADLARSLRVEAPSAACMGALDADDRTERVSLINVGGTVVAVAEGPFHDELMAMERASITRGHTHVSVVLEYPLIRVVPRLSRTHPCYSCFLVRHRSQLAAREKNSHSYCIECED